MWLSCGQWEVSKSNEHNLWVRACGKGVRPALPLLPFPLVDMQKWWWGILEPGEQGFSRETEQVGCGVCVCVCVYTYTNAHIHKHTHIYMYTQLTYIHIYTHTHYICIYHVYIHTHIYKEIYYKELTQAVMKVDKFQVLQSANWRPRWADAIVPVWVWRPGKQASSRCDPRPQCEA